MHDFTKVEVEEAKMDAATIVQAFIKAKGQMESLYHEWPFLGDIGLFKIVKNGKVIDEVVFD